MSLIRSQIKEEREGREKGWRGMEKRARAQLDRRPCNSCLCDPSWHLLTARATLKSPVVALIWKIEMLVHVERRVELVTAKAPRCPSVGVPYIFFYKKKGNGALYLTEMASALFLCGVAWVARLGLGFSWLLGWYWPIYAPTFSRLVYTYLLIS